MSAFRPLIPPAFAALIDPADPHDPIAAQVLPSAEEDDAYADERIDPIGDDVHTPVRGLVCRYPDRVLFKVTSACSVHCRFCFRQGLLEGERSLTLAAINAALAWIAEHTAIREVILSGGDPLTLSARRLGAIVRRLQVLPHVRVVRFHTRVPVADPSRVTSSLARALRGAGLKPVYGVLHCNHAREMTDEARAACGRLMRAGISLFAQSVLLRGVNDTPESLEALLRTLFENGIKPAYLHILDRAPGTAHFRVPLRRAQDLMRSVRGRVSGLAQPTLVLDIPGGFGKVPVGPTYATASTLPCWTVEDPWGERHVYSDLPGPESA